MSGEGCCVLPDEALLGEEGRGFEHIMRNFQWERLVMALAAVSGAERTLESAIAYARERNAFGRPVLPEVQSQKAASSLLVGAASSAGETSFRN